MFTLNRLASSCKAFSYYSEQGEYYLGGGDKGIGLWLGKGAKELGLKGKIAPQDFKALLSGHLPTGETMTQVKKGCYHRPGYDLTFSAPKSVSLLALVADNQAVLQAHQEAVQQTLEYIESRHAACRNKKRNEIQIERTRNWVVASFEQIESRALDPDLHTHCVVMNITQRGDKAWRTLFLDEVYQNQRTIGRVYDAYLAQELMKKGYELEIKSDGNFEIKGVPQALIEHFSKRRHAIQACLERKGLKGAKAAEWANFVTRSPKNTTTKESLQNKWLKELEGLSTSLEALKNLAREARSRGPIPLPDAGVLAEQAIHSAIRHLSERLNHFSFHYLIKTAKRLSLLPTNEGELLKAIETLIENKNLIYLENKLLTTKEIFELDNKNNELINFGKNSVYKILPNWIARIQTRNLGTAQQEVLNTLLTSEDRQILLHSNSKNILNQTLKTFIRLTKAQGFYPRVLTQRQFEVEALKSSLQTERVHTLAGFLLACEERSLKRGEPRSLLERWDRRIKKAAAKDIWIVRGELSAKQLNTISQQAESLGARLVFAYTKPVAALTELKEITRVELKAHQRDIEQLSCQAALLEKLETLHRSSLLQESVNPHQSALSAHQPGNLLLCLTPFDKALLNQEARSLLQQNGHLSQPKASVQILRPLNLSLEEKSKLQSYQPGDILRFNRGLEGSQEAQYFEVEDIHLNEGQLRLKGEGLIFSWELKQSILKQIEVFKPEQRDIQVGEIIVWTRSIKCIDNGALSQVKGQQASVISIQAEEISVRLENGKLLKLKTSHLSSQHWEYGYAVTLLEAPLKADQKIIGLLDKVDKHNLSLLNQALEKITSEKIPAQFFCRHLAQLKQSVLEPILIDKPLEMAYHRAEALENYQTLGTQPLFNRLQSAFLKVNQLNPEFENRTSSSEPEPALSPELRRAVELIDRVALYHSEREAVMKRDTLIEEGLKLGQLSLSVKDLEAAIELGLEKGWLVSIGENEQGQALVATKHTLLLEKRCIEQRKTSQNTVHSILNPDSNELQAILNHPRLTRGQKEAIQLILTTKDSIIAVQGIAGSGKTTALREVKRMMEANQFKTTVLANTASAKNQAKTKSEMEASTTAQFLTRLESALNKNLPQAKQELGGQHLYIVDESSMASTLEVFRMQSIVEKLGARLVWTGDFKQQGSIGAGLQFHDMLAYGISHAVMRENVRLSDKSALTAMKQAYRGEVRGTVQTLKNRIEEIPIKEQALSKIVAAYLELSLSHPDLLVIIPLNKDRQTVNELIRARLKEKGILSQPGIEIEVLLPADKREIEKTEASSYKVGEMVRFNTPHPRLGIEREDYASVEAVDLTHQRLTLKVEGKKLTYWSPKDLGNPSDIEIYQKARRELSVKDCLVFKRNQEQRGIFNGDRATILKIEERTLEVRLANGQTTSLDLSQKQNCHLDHGYALTTYAAQGREAYVIAYLEGAQAMERTSKQLKVGDRIIWEAKQNPYAKVVTITQIKGSQMTLRDRRGDCFEVPLNSKESWQYFPALEKHPSRRLPLSTSQQAFISDITRGDNLLLVVPNIEDLQVILERHHRPKRSALSYQDQNWGRLSQAVNQLVADIKGREALDSLKPPDISMVLPEKAVSLKPKSHYIDKEALEWRLQQSLLDHATQWLGPPKKVSKQEARWEGTLTLTLQGAKAGLWKRWSTGEGGKGLISLYMAAFGVDWKTAIKELSERLGLNQRETLEDNPLRFKKTKETLKATERSREEKIKRARDLYDKGQPIQGTLAETYLKHHRGIEGELPSEFRFIPKAFHFETREFAPALLAPIKDKTEALIGVVRVFLNPDGSKYNKTFLDEKGQTEKTLSKANLGLSGGGAVTVQKGKSLTTLFVAEGVETALSVAKAVPDYTVMASLSVNQFKNVPVSLEVQKIVICADRDGINSQTYKSVVEAVDHHLSQGRQVFLALPETLQGIDKYDFNDLLKVGGISAVQHSLAQKFEIKDTNLLKREGVLTALHSSSIDMKSQLLEKNDSPSSAPAIRNQRQFDRSKEVER